MRPRAGEGGGRRGCGQQTERFILNGPGRTWRGRGGVGGGDVNQNVSPAPADKSLCLFLSFVQVALSRVMPLKCQLSAWARIALDIKYSSPHTNTAVSCGVIRKRNKIWSPHFPSPPRGPVHLLFVRLTDVFQMTLSHVSWTSRQSRAVRDPRRYTPSDGGKPPRAWTPCAARLPSGECEHQRQRLTGWSKPC